MVWSRCPKTPNISIVSMMLNPFGLFNSFESVLYAASTTASVDIFSPLIALRTKCSIPYKILL
jgi:hypothetical protein